MTANGNAFHALTLEASTYLSSLNALDYYREPLQSDSDMRLFDVVAGFREATGPQRMAFENSLDESQKALLALFAHRAATISVRLNSATWLENAFLASVIANHNMPETRNIDRQLAVLYTCCGRYLELNTVKMFDWAATYAQDPLASHLESFGRRDDVSLQKFGWNERRTPDGIKFSARWE